MICDLCDLRFATPTTFSGQYRTHALTHMYEGLKGKYMGLNVEPEGN